METFNAYPTETIQLSNGKEVTIEPYRVGEIRNYIAPFDKAQAKFHKIISKYDLLNPNKKPRKQAKKLKIETEEEALTQFQDIIQDKVKDIPRTEGNIEKLYQINEELIDLTTELTEITNKVAQLGLKRALIPDAENKIGNELNEYPDIPIIESDSQKITGVMIRLGKKGMPTLKSGKK